MSWQRANIQAAVTYLREQMKGDLPRDARVKEFRITECPTVTHPIRM
jgi:hypothetical protein